jgi:hypothetical protein
LLHGIEPHRVGVADDSGLLTEAVHERAAFRLVDRASVVIPHFR